MEKRTTEETTTTNIHGEEAPPTTRSRARRGFAVMAVERVREIARIGGKAAHEAGTAHEFTSEEARLAGRKGGLAPHRPRTTSKQKPHAATQQHPAAQQAPNGERGGETSADRG